jgi:hypothetical protein
MDDGSAVVLERSLEGTLELLAGDGRLYGSLMRTLLANWEDFVQDLLSPHPIPQHSMLTFLGFGLPALPGCQPGEILVLAERRQSIIRRAEWALMLPLEHLASGLTVLCWGRFGHAVGWPLPAKEGSITEPGACGSLSISWGDSRDGKSNSAGEQLPTIE